MSPKHWFAVVIGCQLAYLGAVVAYHESRVQSGTHVLLQTAPVDPESVFRGRYVVLNYDLSRLPTTLLVDRQTALQPGQALYVVLQPGTNVWKAASLHTAPPVGGVYLRGRVNYVSGQDVVLQYGIETFFLSESSADEIERRRREVMLSRATDTMSEGLTADEARLARAGLSEWWLNQLTPEMDRWVADGLMTKEHEERIRTKYQQAFEHIDAARRTPSPQRSTTPLTVEISVTADGVGYPVKLFWDGREYR